MKLIDPQPMETLPEEGEVCTEWQHPETGERRIIMCDVFNIRYHMPYKKYGTYHAWSYTATTKEEE